MLLSGCGAAPSGGESQQEEEIAYLEDPNLGLTEEFTAALEQALIMLADSSTCISGGVVQTLTGLAPTVFDGTVMIPAAFVAQWLGGSAEYSPEQLETVVTVGETTIRIPDNGEAFYVNDAEVELTGKGIITRQGSSLIPAEEYCQALNQPLTMTEGLLVIGRELPQTDNPDSASLVLDAMRQRMSTPAVVTGSTPAGTYQERSTYSESIVIDPTVELAEGSQVLTSAPADTLLAVAGSLYVENLVVTVNPEGGYIVEMDIYNYLGYTYGSAEVYDKDENLVDHDRIAPFEGQKSSIISAITDVFVLSGDLSKTITTGTDYMNHRSDLNAKKTSVTLNVPDGGYIFITCNPQHSDYVALYNAIHTLVSIMNASGDLAGSEAPEQDGQSLKDKVVDTLVKELTKDPTAFAEIVTEFREIALPKEQCMPWQTKEIVLDTAEKILDMFQRADINIGKMLEDAVKSNLSGAIDKGVEEFLEKALPMTKVALDSWKISANFSNLFCLFMDLENVNHTKSLIIEISDWRAAYAQLLRERTPGDGTQRFTLAFIDGDNVPELIAINAVAHYGSSVEIYSYRFRQIHTVQDSYGHPYLDVAYASLYYVEYASTVVRGNFHMGITSTNYLQLDENYVLDSTHVFYDDEQFCEGSGDKPTYNYNDEVVSRWQYMYLLNKLDNQYADSTVYLDGFTDGWAITEANIKEVLKH